MTALTTERLGEIEMCLKVAGGLPPYLKLRDALALVAAARAERDENKWCKSKLIEMRAERDSARALLRTSDALFENTRSLLRASVPGPNYRASAIAQAIDDHRARIAAELGDKP